MLKKLFANTFAKKTSVFTAVFAITCILMGSQLGSLSRESELVQAMAMAPLMEGQVVSAVAAAAYHRVEQEPDLPTLSVSGEYPLAGMDPNFGATVGDLMAGKRPRIAVTIPTPEGFVYSEDIPMSMELQKYTYNQCVKKGLEYELVLALMWRESRFKVDAVGYNSNGTQDSGIMQINDVNKGWLKTKLGIDDLMDPLQNIDAGTTMLSGFTTKYGVHDGLMAYQYGEVGMQQKFAQGIVTNDNIAILMDKREDFRAILQ